MLEVRITASPLLLTIFRTRHGLPHERAGQGFPDRMRQARLADEDGRRSGLSGWERAVNEQSRKLGGRSARLAPSTVHTACEGALCRRRRPALPAIPAAGSPATRESRESRGSSPFEALLSHCILSFCSIVPAVLHELLGTCEIDVKTAVFAGLCSVNAPLRLLRRA